MEQLDQAVTYGRLSISLFGADEHGILSSPRTLRHDGNSSSSSDSEPGVSLDAAASVTEDDEEALATATAIIERAQSMSTPPPAMQTPDTGDDLNTATDELAPVALAPGTLLAESPSAGSVVSVSDSAASTSVPSSPDSAASVASAPAAAAVAENTAVALNNASGIGGRQAALRAEAAARMDAGSPTGLLDALALAPVAPESSASLGKRARGLEALVRALKRDLERRDECVRGLRGALAAAEGRNGELTTELVAAKMQVAEMQAERDVLRNARAKLDHRAEAFAEYTRGLEEQLIAAKALSFMHAERAAERASQLEAAQRAAAASREAAAAAEAAAHSPPRVGRQKSASTGQLKVRKQRRRRPAPGNAHVVSTMLLGGQPGKGGKGSLWRAPAPYLATDSPPQRLRRRPSSAGQVA